LLNRLARPSAAALLAAAICLPLAGCGRDVSASSTPGSAAERGAPVASEIAALAAPGAPYRTVAVRNGGAVRGHVSVSGDVPADTVVRLTSDQTVCGTQLADETIAVANGRLEGAVVWLAGVRAGKPLPVERRYELLNERCRLYPRVQAAVVGGTVNVRSADPLVVHENRFVRQTRGRPVLAHTHTNDEGQVVPVEQLLGAPGLVEARCDPHPWTHAWVFAFDHPYFATTGRDGSFSIDAVPPGRYTLVVWHERGPVVTKQVTIGAGQAVSADVEWKAEE
jgi:hypothetical protein